MSNNVENIIPVKQLLMKIYIDCIVEQLLVHCYMFVLSHSLARGSPFIPHENRSDLLQVVNSEFVRCDAIPELLNSLYLFFVGRCHDSEENVLRF